MSKPLEVIVTLRQEKHVPTRQEKILTIAVMAVSVGLIIAGRPR